MARREKKPGKGLAKTVMLFFFTAFLLLFLRDYNKRTLILAVAIPAVVWVGAYLLPKLFPVDGLLMSLTNFLCGLGVLVLYSTNEAYAFQQAVCYGVGMVAMVVCIYLVRLIRSWRFPALVMIPVALLLLSLPLLGGEEINGARNWIRFAGVSVQPSEAVKLCLLLILSYYMSRRQVIPWLFFVLACLALLMLQKDLGTALLYYGTCLALFWASGGGFALTLLGVAGGAGAAVMGYRMFAHVKKRVAIWRNPFADYDNSGYQLAQGLMAMASGGLFGVGLGLGSPTAIPVYESDFIFAVLCEQFGLIFGLCVVLVYVAIIRKGAAIAREARASFHGLLAMGCTVLLGLQTFVIIGGVIKLIPLTGITLPFVSYGGSSLVSSLCVMGLLQGVASLNEDDLEEDAHLAMLD